MKNLEGLCPVCKEHTTAGKSCCGFGAIVGGSVITDESAQEMIEEEEAGEV